MYEYKMVQIPQAVSQSQARKKRTDREAADYLEELANTMAADRWEFEGLESMDVVTPPGCLGFGQPQRRSVYVATFRRDRRA